MGSILARVITGIIVSRFCSIRGMSSICSVCRESISTRRIGHKGGASVKTITEFSRFSIIISIIRISRISMERGQEKETWVRGGLVVRMRGRGKSKGVR